jgi:hypothetical protein
MIKIGKQISSTFFSSCNKEKSEGCEAKKSLRNMQFKTTAKEMDCQED